MKRTTLLTIIAVAVLVVFGGIVLSKNNTNQPNSTETDHASMNQKSDSKTNEKPKENEIFIQDFAYSPESLTIKKGTTITWTNKDEAHHDITPIEMSDNFKPSKLLAQGESYSFTFESAGTYNYKCSPHPYMKGTVVVTE